MHVTLMRLMMSNKFDRVLLCIVQSLTTIVNQGPVIIANYQLRDISGLSTLAQANSCTAVTNAASPQINLYPQFQFGNVGNICQLNTYDRVCKYIQNGFPGVGC